MYKNIKRTCSDCFCSLNLLFCGVLVAVAVVVAKKLPRETMRTVATGTSENNKCNLKNTGSARALYNLVHFFVVLSKQQREMITFKVL